MREDFIEDHERLYRAVPDRPSHWKPKFNRPTTALFKDPHGASVDRDGRRAENELIEHLRTEKPGYGLVKLVAQDCRGIPTHPVPRPLPANAYHAEIHDSENQVEIRTKWKRRALVTCCEVVLAPDEF